VRTTLTGEGARLVGDGAGARVLTGPFAVIAAAAVTFDDAVAAALLTLWISLRAFARADFFLLCTYKR